MTNKNYLFQNIEGGSLQPLFEILEFKFGIYCKTPESQSMYWEDFRGSIGKYHQLKGVEKATANALDFELNEKLIHLNSENFMEIEADIVNLLQFLPGNQYTATFISSSDMANVEGYNHYQILFPHYDTAVTTAAEMYNSYSAFFYQAIAKHGMKYQPDVIDFASSCFHDYETQILATKHESTLDAERINFYRREIENGKRPTLILVAGITDYFGKTNAFIFDGHHKAMAYRQAQINPNIIEIVSELTQRQDILTDLRTADELLYDAQMAHLIASRYVNHPVISSIKDDEILGKYCLNGPVEEYYPNGRLKETGHYLDLKKHGIFTYYYPDGSLKYKVRYEMDRLVERC